MNPSKTCLSAVRVVAVRFTSALVKYTTGKLNNVNIVLLEGIHLASKEISERRGTDLDDVDA